MFYSIPNPKFSITSVVTLSILCYKSLDVALKIMFTLFPKLLIVSVLQEFYDCSSRDLAE